MQITEEARQQEQNDDDRPEPPANADRFVARLGGMLAPYSEEWAEDEHFEPPDDVDGGQYVEFDKGDTLPRAYVEDVWPHFSDKIIPLDEAGDRIGEDGEAKPYY